MVSTLWYLALLAAVGVERLFELRLSARHATLAFARGGIEYGQRHFGFMKLLHTGLLLGAAVEVVALGRPFTPALGWPMLALVLVSQGLRYWAVASLGEQWNVRVIVVPGAPAVTRGPYRYLRHPNYVAVVLEGIALPLVHDAWITAAIFGLANAALLAVRIRCEERALRAHADYDARLGGARRFWPRLAHATARSRAAIAPGGPGAG